MKIKNKKTKIFLISLGSLVLLGGFYITSAAVLRIIATSSDNFQIPDIEKGLIGYWSLAQEDLKSSTVMADLTPHTNNGTIAGTIIANDQRNTANRALSFIGDTSSYLKVDTFPDFPSTAISVSFWAKTSASGDGIFSYSTGNTPNDNEFLIYDPSSLLIYRPGTSLNSGVAINDNAWHHVVVSWQSSNGALVVYKDGVSAYSNTGLATGSSIVNGGCLYLAQEQDALCGLLDSAQSFNGSLSDVRIYNRVLSAAEAKSLYQSYRPSMVIPDIEKGLIARFPLDNETKQSTTTFTDITPNAYIGTITPGTSAGLVPDQRGVASRAYDFDGSATRVDLLASNVIIPNHGAVTISFWAKMDVINASDYLFGTRRSVGGSYLSMRMPGNTAGKMGWIHPNGTGVLVGDGSATLVAGQWYYFTFVKNGNSNIGYVNGIEDYNASAAYSVSPSADVAKIGDLATSNAFDGQISDVRIYNRVLSAIEVQQLYQTYQ